MDVKNETTKVYQWYLFKQIISKDVVMMKYLEENENVKPEMIEELYNFYNAIKNRKLIIEIGKSVIRGVLINTKKAICSENKNDGKIITKLTNVIKPLFSFIEPENIQVKLTDDENLALINNIVKNNENAKDVNLYVLIGTNMIMSLVSSNLANVFQQSENFFNQNKTSDEYLNKLYKKLEKNDEIKESNDHDIFQNNTNTSFYDQDNIENINNISDDDILYDTKENIYENKENDVENIDNSEIYTEDVKNYENVTNETVVTETYVNELDKSNHSTEIISNTVSEEIVKSKDVDLFKLFNDNINDVVIDDEENKGNEKMENNVELKEDLFEKLNSQISELNENNKRSLENDDTTNKKVKYAESYSSSSSMYSDEEESNHDNGEEELENDLEYSDIPKEEDIITKNVNMLNNKKTATKIKQMLDEFKKNSELKSSEKVLAFE